MATRSELYRRAAELGINKNNAQEVARTGIAPVVSPRVSSPIDLNVGENV